METTGAEGAAAAAAGGGLLTIVWLVVLVLMIVSMWKIFSKAGQPGWAAIIPIYNIIVLLQVAGKPIWWIILMFIPIANIIVGILMMVGLATNFGKGAGYVIGMIFLPIIFYPMLAFGSAEYQPMALAEA
jgi:hypothetical protein